MRISELGSNSMAIMKDSEDPFWSSIGNIYRQASSMHGDITVERIQGYDGSHAYRQTQVSHEFIYSGGRLVLFFEEDVKPEFQLYDRVSVFPVYRDIRR